MNAQTAGWITDQVDRPRKELLVDVCIPVNIAVQHSRMVCLALLEGNKSKALHIVGRAFETAEENGPVTAVSRLDRILPTRLATILGDHGIASIRQLILHSEDQLLTIPQIGQKTIREIRHELGKHGFELRSDD